MNLDTHAQSRGLNLKNSKELHWQGGVKTSRSLVSLVVLFHDRRKNKFQALDICMVLLSISPENA